MTSHADNFDNPVNSQFIDISSFLAQSKNLNSIQYNHGNYRKKLIEVSLPLEAINKESAREKSIRHGHPSTLHLWWARRPLAACRAVLFASLVDDPSSHPDKFPTEEAQEAERKRLFEIIEQLVKWENINNKDILDAAKTEILKSTNNNPPPVLDPFCGGGSIPLEAQRLGLEAHGSDLNPVAVLITKTLIEIPPKFADRPPVNPDSQSTIIPNQKSKIKNLKFHYGAQGLAEDVRYYGQWMRDKAFKQIGHLYPKVNLPQEYGGGEATVIAWLWARTVKCPNPGCGMHTPLLTSFVLAAKKGKEKYLIPCVSDGKVEFSVSDRPPNEYQDPKKGLKRGMSGVFECIACKTVTTRNYVSQEGKAKRLGLVQTAVVVQGQRGRLYLPAKFSPCPTNIPNADTTGLNVEFSPNPRDVWCRNFGLDTPADLFTPRQLVALTTFSDLVSEAREKALADAVAAGMPDDGLPLNEGGTGATAYADAVVTYLAIAVDRISDYNSSICSWHSGRDIIRNTFARQAIPMTWDFAEANLLSDSTGNFIGAVNWISKVIEISPCSTKGVVKQIDATRSDVFTKSIVVSTDPPYYDNIGYADLSDFFYVWLRRCLGSIYPDLFATLLVPKAQELVATPYRFGGNKQKAKEFFEAGLGQVFKRMREMAHDEYPLTVYYAFKQTETEATDEDSHDLAVASTGWETMLEGLIKAGFTITGTLPMRTELSNRTVASGTNALASSIALVCRPRPETAPSTTRRQFVNTLKRELPAALHQLQQGNIAPVDLAQASIGPGMAIYSRYTKVLESDGTPMRVRTALQLINQTLDEFLAEQEGEFDAETRFALTWFEQYAFSEGLFGDAETLSKAKNTAVQSMVDAGILVAKAGKVRLLRRSEILDFRLKILDCESESKIKNLKSKITIWAATQHMIRELQDGGGDRGAANLLSQLGNIGEAARELAYRLYDICDRKGWAAEGVAYNSLVISWSDISRLADEKKEATPLQGELEF
jgi:putative DNA methylase